MARTDPYPKFRYHVELDGISKASFSEATIGSSGQDPIEFRSGNDPDTNFKQPGMIRYANVVLKQGTTDNTDLFKWRQSIENGKVKENRKKMAIVLLDSEGNSKARWEFSEAWPVKYSAPDL